MSAQRLSHASSSFRSLKMDGVDEPEPPATWRFESRQGTVEVVNIEKSLWLAFTFHTLHTDPNEPEHVSFRGFLNLCRECDLLSSSRVLVADLQVMYTSHASKRAQRNLDFPAFLQALLAVVARYDASEPFERFIRLRVMPQASKREQKPLVLSDGAEVAALQREFTPGLMDMFTFYATASSARRLSSPAKPSPAKIRNHMTDALSYANFRDFALDMGLAAVDLSAADLADVFLLELADLTEFDPATVPGKITFDAFMRCLVRCSLLAFARFPVQDSRRVKALFAHCWRAIEEGVPRAIAERRITQGFAGSLMHGSARFSARFAQMWRQDGFPDYLVDAAPDASRAIDLVRAM